ncbi:DUF819 family protein [Neisseriaceae bacterium PsAf]|nr:DUF819 family protein [Neisseriaceae bacterium PsAf]MCV2502984.1 DUF819 family protein [Neisseriaceae bacterium]
MDSLISSENTIWLWTFLISTAAISIYLEQKYRWAAQISGVIIALAITMIAVNLNIIPNESIVYDTVWTYIVPLSIPLLLFSVDIKNIFYSSHRLLILFLISSLGTFLGTLIAYYLLSDYQPGLDKIAATLAASYTGGTVNLVTMAAKANLPKENLFAVFSCR